MTSGGRLCLALLRDEPVQPQQEQTDPVERRIGDQPNRQQHEQSELHIGIARGFEIPGFAVLKQVDVQVERLLGKAAVHAHL